MARQSSRCGVELGRGVVHGLLRRAGKLELAARLQRDAADRFVVAQADGVVAVVERMPAGARFDALEQRADAVARPHRARAGSGLCG